MKVVGQEQIRVEDLHKASLCSCEMQRACAITKVLLKERLSAEQSVSPLADDDQSEMPLLLEVKTSPELETTTKNRQAGCIPQTPKRTLMKFEKPYNRLQRSLPPSSIDRSPTFGSSVESLTLK